MTSKVDAHREETSPIVAGYVEGCVLLGTAFLVGAVIFLATAGFLRWVETLTPAPDRVTGEEVDGLDEAYP